MNEDEPRAVADWSRATLHTDGPDGAYFGAPLGTVKLDRHRWFNTVTVTILHTHPRRRRFWLWNKRTAQRCFDEFRAELQESA